MFTRLLIIMLMVTLALPLAALTPPNPTSDAPWGANVVTAKAKKQAKNKNTNKKKRKKQNKELPPPTTPTPTPTTVTRTVRGPVTETFSSAENGLGQMNIPGGAPGTTKGSANPYPSSMTISGFANGAITDIDLVLQDFSHPVPEDVDILLVAPDGRRALVMSDAGRIFRVTNIDLTLDDEAAAPLTQFELDSGVYRPTDFSSAGDVPDAFPAPAPALDGRVALSAFDGADPNGTWQLFVVDDASGDAGDLRGWELRITAEVDTGTVEEQAPRG